MDKLLAETILTLLYVFIVCPVFGFFLQAYYEEHPKYLKSIYLGIALQIGLFVLLFILGVIFYVLSWSFDTIIGE